MITRRATRWLLGTLAASAVGWTAGSLAKAPPKPPVRTLVPGKYLLAHAAAQKKFDAIPNLPAQKRDLRNYRIEFWSEKGRIYVYYVPRQPPQRDPKKYGGFLGGEARYGTEFLCILRAKDLSVIKSGQLI